MVMEQQNDPFKGVDWKSVGSDIQKDPGGGAKMAVKKRLPKRIRQVPEYYFLPRRSWPATLAFAGSCIAGGIAAGYLAQLYVNKRIAEDRDIIWKQEK